MGHNHTYSTNDMWVTDTEDGGGAHRRMTRKDWSGLTPNEQRTLRAGGEVNKPGLYAYVP